MTLGELMEKYPHGSVWQFTPWWRPETPSDPVRVVGWDLEDDLYNVVALDTGYDEDVECAMAYDAYALDRPGWERIS